MFVLVLLIIPVACLKISAPIPPDRAKISVVQTVLAKQGTGRSLDRGPAETAVEFNSRKPAYPQFETYDTSDKLLKQFRDTKALEKELAEKFDPKRHVLLFVRWYSWACRDKISINISDEDAKVQFVHHCYEAERNDTPIRIEHNYVFVIGKDTKWKLGTKFEDK